MQFKNPIVSEVRSRIRLMLELHYSLSEAVALSNVLIGHYFGLKPYEISLYPERACFPVILRKINRAVVRLIKNEPIQYIIGSVEFCELNLTVNPNVLIPRPETEELVAWIEEDFKARTPSGAGLQFLDVGTGSGAIALAIKSKFGQATVQATDISASAISVARNNSKSLNLPIELTLVDVFNDEMLQLSKKLDLIVSNPPYVRVSETTGMKQGVLFYEPHEALFVPDDDPLIFYRRIVDIAGFMLNPGGSIYFEINEMLSREVLELFGPQWKAGLRKDFFGKYRFVRAIRL